MRGLFLAALLGLQAEKPALFEGCGKLVCLIEEMKEKYQAQAAPGHDHLWGFRVDDKAQAGGARYYTLFRNAGSEALFVDRRFRDRELRLYGRVFPSSSVLEVSRFQWYREGKLMDVYYWCEVCSIRGVDPGPCACCQAKVELRESPVQEK
ncbi:MAG TPA: hypothetical protein VEN81_00730 [Planctomycetota bacterium]|nr:hypothetical protein [Planctomycetota bacterium]